MHIIVYILDEFSIGTFNFYEQLNEIRSYVKYIQSYYFVRCRKHLSSFKNVLFLSLLFSLNLF